MTDKMYHFTSCGLDNIWLANGVEFKQTPRGEMVKIHNLDGLHKAIAKSIITGPNRICGAEFRFLRSMLGVSQEGLGDILTQSRSTIARWEAERDKPIDGACDKLLRIIYMRKADGDERVGRLIDMLVDLDEEIHGRKRTSFREYDGAGWARDTCVAA
ncbi:hypothetical protein LHT11_01610 [Acetobacter indonesiensis]|uniref:helix-turn-helix domain-containing protein n=1 Tax=Acetobacter indonesiensis TaxID=104101 RepID=UPI001F1CFC91|nr:hypothetical protein [Acetobacter indonesiensis]MCG0993897.1 hypothetical protein [Acetobacter indonesiensis]